MSDEAKQATPRADLARRVLDVNVPKSETEWWAQAEITSLTRQLAEAKGEVAKWKENWRQTVARCEEEGTERETAEAKVAAMTAALEPFKSLTPPDYVPDDALLVLAALNGGVIDTRQNIYARDIRRAHAALALTLTPAQEGKP